MSKPSFVVDFNFLLFVRGPFNAFEMYCRCPTRLLSVMLFESIAVDYAIMHVIAE